MFIVLTYILLYVCAHILFFVLQTFLVFSSSPIACGILTAFSCNLRIFLQLSTVPAFLSAGLHYS